MAELSVYYWLGILLVLLLLLVAAWLLLRNRQLERDNRCLHQQNRNRMAWWWQGPDLLVRLDAGGKILEFNHAGAGLDLRDDALFIDLLPESSRDYFLQAFQGALVGAAPDAFEVLHEDGLSASEILLTGISSDGERQVMVVVHDLTRIAVSRQQLIADKDQAERANLAKSRFLASMSHEIRTPMTGLLGMVSLMEQTDLNEEQQGFQRVIQSSSEHLLAIINDILDISRIDAGKMSLEEEVFDLPELVQNLLDMVSGKVQEKRLSLQSFVDDQLPDKLVGDPMRIRQILINYLNNAIKFTREGHVLLRVALVRDLHSSVQLRFSVEDSGIGIGANRVMALFEEYSFAHGRISADAGGSGLGLSICQRLAKLMNGHVGVVSSPGIGSNFWFDVTLPVAVCEQKPQPATLLPTEKSIWIVDDLLVNRTLLISVARSMDMMSRDFTSAAELLPLLANEQPALLVISQRCYEESPAEFRRLLQQRQMHVGLSSPDVLTTGKNELLAAGIGAYWDWPISQSNLKELLNVLLHTALPVPQLITRASRYLHRRHDEQVAPVLADNADVLQGCRILLAEDNPVNQKVAGQMLKRLGCEVTIVDNGQQAVQKSAEAEFDLLLMDCHMPVMDGMQACQEIRQREQRQGLVALPIVALSADVMADRKAECEAVGMNGYLAKPIRLEDLRRELPEFLAPVIHR
ncbi:response regulator [Oceanobacter mangrovi]|uniref:response regulator n=1 Tax=Oceanobacter mangrovi TaxID=2862510 RepID=UPI001FE250C9|nr:response regulator [Oceanobacter mangrovi]